jgi:hypothetical protein
MEAAAGIAGFVSLTCNVFESCVQAYDFFYVAQHIGADGDVFNTRVKFEQYRLLQWGIKAGLTQSATPSSRLNWPLAYALLQQLEIFLTSAEKLRASYSLDVNEEEVEAKERTEIQHSPPTGIGKFIARLKPEIYTLKGQIIQANNSTFKRLRWATFGKDKADAVLRDISDVGSRLDQLLDSLEQEKRAKVDEVLLRDILSRSSTASEVDQIQQILEPSVSSDYASIKAAATLKQIRLVIGADTRDDEVKTAITKHTKEGMPSIRILKHKKLTPYTLEVPVRYQGIEVVRYDQQPVLVEWKMAEGPMWEQLTNQVRSLAVLLASPAGKASQSLLCIGYLPWREREIYALVYAIPNAIAQDVSDHWRLKTLHDLILEQSHLSLGRRFEIARMLADVVLQLHTAGWLHKSLRSENVIFIASNDSSTGDFLNSPPYLVGFEYARPDTADAAMFTQLPDAELANDLYRHPQARGIRREKYRKQFDMYALGCLLVEIGLWGRLLELMNEVLDEKLAETIKEANMSNRDIELPSLSSLGSQPELLEPLLHSTGESFAEAIVLCTAMSNPDEHDADVSLDTQHAVVQKLRQCKF